MEPRINLITLGVRHLETAVHFYEHGLGLAQKDFGTPGIAFFPLQGSWLALYGREELAADAGVAATGSGFSAITLAHNVHSEAEVDAVLNQATAAGATLIKSAERACWGGYSGYFADPDGHLWEVAYNPFFWPGIEPETLNPAGQSGNRT